MMTNSLIASPVERLVRPPTGSGLSIQRHRPLPSGGSNAGIDRRGTQRDYTEVLDEKHADSASGRMTCCASPYAD